MSSETGVSVTPVAGVAVAATVLAVLGCGEIPSDGASQHPCGHGYHAMAYDAESGKVVFFGGQTGDIENRPLESIGDTTWALDPRTSSWKLMQPALRPGPLTANAIAYDSESDRIVIYGGVRVADPSSITFMNETWAYDLNSNTWNQMSDGPTGRINPRMAYDSESDRIILFGGSSFNPEHPVMEYFAETWSYDLNTDTWTRMSPDISPQARHLHGLVYVDSADRVVLWGGRMEGELDRTVWAYDLNSDSWAELPATEGPQPRGYHAMTYDAGSQRIVVYGGTKQGNSETWSYDCSGNTWYRMKPQVDPGNLGRMSMVYCASVDRVILFGGQKGAQRFAYSDETWFYDLDADAWHRATTP